MKTSRLKLITTVLSVDSQAGDSVQLVKCCEGCEGQDGPGTAPDVPVIAGFSEEGFLNTIDVFRENERTAQMGANASNGNVVSRRTANRSIL